MAEFALLAGCVLLPPAQVLAMESPTEQEVTVAFIFNFLRFSEWPANSLQQSLRLCVSENTPFENELRVIAGRQIQNIPLSIKRLAWGDSLNDCQALFIAREEKRARAGDWLKLASGKPVLTIGNAGDFLDQGGMIALVLDGARLQFEIHLTPVNACGLKLSGQLLKIAREVRGLAEKQ